MLIAEQFLEDNPQVADKPWELFKTYNSWLKLQYRKCPSEDGKKRLQEEADRFSKIYTNCIKELFLNGN